MRLVCGKRWWLVRTFFSWWSLGPLLLAALLVLTGCIPAIEVTQSSVPIAVATVAPRAHDLAILGVDFDPPLDDERLLTGSAVTLLVAVENRGLAAEEDVQVVARLLDVADPENSRELYAESVVVEKVPAGEVHFVRFTQTVGMPLREHYRLDVEVLPVAGETERNDNLRSYDIVIRAGQ